MSGRPQSSAAGRAASRRGAATAAAAPDPAADAVEAEDEPMDEGGATTTWKAELESIMSGSHPALIEALEPHEQKMKALIAQADRVRKREIANIDALYECEKKQAEDENKAQLEFFKSRLIDGIEEKRKKALRAGGDGPAAGSGSSKAGTADKGRKRPLEPPTGCLPASFALLKPEEVKADLEELNTNVDHYSVRNAASGATEANSANTTDAWFDRQRQMLHCNNLALERGQSVVVLMQGQRVDDTWQVHAMNAVEVTLRDSDGTKLKVTLAQLRNGRYALRPVQQGFM